MRVLHVVKTSDGGIWAARQAAELKERGVEIHVVVPRISGTAMEEWRRSGARIHVCPLDFPASAPWQLPALLRAARDLAAAVKPDLIHSHFVGPTLLLRMALGKDSGIPRAFQVAGPLHLEHRLFRTLDLASAGSCDSWIGTSQCIVDAYRNAGVSSDRLFLSYHGGSASEISATRTRILRKRLGISDHEFVVGNVNFMYPPKRYLGQRTGIKCHEHVIDALALVLQQRSDVVGVLIGGVFGKGRWYEDQLRARARAAGRGRILMPGYLSGRQVSQSWADFDCAVHVPLSENCGGVIEPLLASVPTIAAQVGGLPEVVKDGLTGKTVRGNNPRELAAAILDVLHNRERYRALAANGQALVRTMFDVRRTAGEVHGIYHHLLNSAHRHPAEFDSAAFLHTLGNRTMTRATLQPEKGFSYV